ncbi:hypothetical protein IX317_000371 [Fusobacterium sp. DD29]|uniref:hypothetical protein n=1 Tax=unclassified Fusobacterium TaxID=2648384 RepID=UPI001B8D5DF3|nr:MULTISPECIES: hypothetical protein [unclassified Fusobacterium]MBR8748712.1 hypothetical protein [Fusobacterium sp. DD29]MBR8760936.1 hypothetical protein [Fusobacterium sp. DD25]MBR8766991.1 hypothetical protein [Fusobacterium sp. DD43]MBR8770992.1 hypothetical protein [Fusobacterium sp. DD40]MBR8775267.1 hypothetical protein [Fusobacterium sp. DD17]
MIYISGNVPSSKNSKQWTGKFLISSKTVREYVKEHDIDWKLKKEEFKKLISGKEKPYKIGFYFIRSTKRKFDYINACQLPCDLMTKHKWIEDDNCDEIIPVFLGYKVDKETAGVIIKVL